MTSLIKELQKFAVKLISPDIPLKKKYKVLIAIEAFEISITDVFASKLGRSVKKCINLPGKAGLLAQKLVNKWKKMLEEFQKNNESLTEYENKNSKSHERMEQNTKDNDLKPNQNEKRNHEKISKNSAEISKSESEDSSDSSMSSESESESDFQHLKSNSENDYPTNKQKTEKLFHEKPQKYSPKSSEKSSKNSHYDPSEYNRTHNSSNSYASDNDDDEDIENDFISNNIIKTEQNSNTNNIRKQNTELQPKSDKKSSISAYCEKTQKIEKSQYDGHRNRMIDHNPSNELRKSAKPQILSQKTEKIGQQVKNSNNINTDRLKEEPSRHIIKSRKSEMKHITTFENFLIDSANVSADNHHHHSSTSSSTNNNAKRKSMPIQNESSNKKMKLQPAANTTVSTISTNGTADIDPNGELPHIEALSYADTSYIYRKNYQSQEENADRMKLEAQSAAAEDIDCTSKYSSERKIWVPHRKIEPQERDSSPENVRTINGVSELIIAQYDYQKLLAFEGDNRKLQKQTESFWQSLFVRKHKCYQRKEHERWRDAFLRVQHEVDRKLKELSERVSRRNEEKNQAVNKAKLLQVMPGNKSHRRTTDMRR